MNRKIFRGMGAPDFRNVKQKESDICHLLAKVHFILHKAFADKKNQNLTVQCTPLIHSQLILNPVKSRTNLVA